LRHDPPRLDDVIEYLVELLNEEIATKEETSPVGFHNAEQRLICTLHLAPPWDVLVFGALNLITIAWHIRSKNGVFAHLATSGNAPKP
jgi:hypothetical protein